MRHTTHLQYMKIPFCKLKTIMSFSHTSNILLCPIYTLWLKVNSSNVENISLWKVRCYKVVKLTNHAFVKIEQSQEVQFCLLWLFVKNLWIYFSNLVYFCDIFLQNGLWCYNCTKFIFSFVFHSWTSSNLHPFWTPQKHL